MPENSVGFDLNFITAATAAVKSGKPPTKMFQGNFQTATFFTQRDPDDTCSA